MSWIKSNIFAFTALFLIVLINEFTISFLDQTPPLSDSSVSIIRTLDLLLLGIAFHKKISALTLPFINKSSHILISIVFPSLLAVVILDIILSTWGFGYPKSYAQENIQRFPSPYDSFRGKPRVDDHNEFGFRGDFRDRPNSFNIAIFGGSTTYLGDPPIIDLVAIELERQGINVDTFNFGSISSHHSQHVHRLIDFSDKYFFDLVIFYGGGNETLQYTIYDPRPGYPYNFFFRNELAPWKQTILRYSSIIGTIDTYSRGIISGLGNLKRIHMDEMWIDKIVKNYWRDLSLASIITQKVLKPKKCRKTYFLSVLQPGNPSTILQKNVWRNLLSSQHDVRSDAKWQHSDLTHLSPRLEFLDIIHVTQDSRRVIANELAPMVSDILSNKCS